MIGNVHPNIHLRLLKHGIPISQIVLQRSFAFFFFVDFISPRLDCKAVISIWSDVGHCYHIVLRYVVFGQDLKNNNYHN